MKKEILKDNFKIKISEKYFFKISLLNSILKIFINEKMVINIIIGSIIIKIFYKKLYVESEYSMYLDEISQNILKKEIPLRFIIYSTVNNIQFELDLKRLKVDLKENIMEKQKMKNVNLI